MKPTFLLTTMLICCECMANVNVDSCTIVRNKNEQSHFVPHNVFNSDVADFLYLFYEPNLPYNNTRAYNKYCRIAPISKDKGEGRSFLISSEMATNKLKLNHSDLYHKYFDRDLGEMATVKNDIYVRFAFQLTPQIFVINYSFSHYSTEDYDSQSFLATINNEGDIISRICVIGDTIKRYRYNSFVIVDETHFKVYNYSVNIENVKDKEDYGEGLYVKYIDDEMPKTKCVITDYIITDFGHIAKVRVNEPIMLNHDCWNYIDNDTPLVEDDPILEY